MKIGIVFYFCHKIKIKIVLNLPKKLVSFFAWWSCPKFEGEKMEEIVKKQVITRPKLDNDGIFRTGKKKLSLVYRPVFRNTPL